MAGSREHDEANTACRRHCRCHRCGVRGGGKREVAPQGGACQWLRHRPVDARSGGSGHRVRDRGRLPPGPRAGQNLAVGAEGKRADRNNATADEGLAETLTGGNIPELNRSVVASAGPELTVGAERKRGHWGGAGGGKGEGLAERLTRRDVPKVNLSQSVGPGQNLTVGAERDREEGPRGFESEPLAETLTGGNIPELNGAGGEKEVAVGTAFSSGACQHPAIAAEGGNPE